MKLRLHSRHAIPPSSQGPSRPEMALQRIHQGRQNPNRCNKGENRRAPVWKWNSFHSTHSTRLHHISMLPVSWLSILSQSWKSERCNQGENRRSPLWKWNYFHSTHSTRLHYKHASSIMASLFQGRAECQKRIVLISVSHPLSLVVREH